MVSTMRCCGKIRILLFVLLFCCAVLPVRAATSITVDGAQLVPNEDGYSLTVNFTINLSSRQEEAVNKGIALYFVADFELTRSRWYWFDEKVVQRSRTVQLSYHALTRQYRLSSGALHQSFATLNEALRVLSRPRLWQVIEKGEVQADVNYLASVRLWLDPSLMPKTFQMSALSDKDWSQSSGWLSWSFTPRESVAQEPSAPVQESGGEGK